MKRPEAQPEGMLEPPNSRVMDSQRLTGEIFYPATLSFASLVKTKMNRTTFMYIQVGGAELCYKYNAPVLALTYY